MAHARSLPVPDDLWVCGQCYGPTLISTDPTHCPIDGHPRDYGIGCCKNPGDSCASGLFPDYPQYEHQHVRYPTAQYGCGVSASHSSPRYHGQSGPVQRGHSDVWDCTECDMTSNAGWLDFCPQCGSPKPASNDAVSSHFITFSSGAGSVAQGMWVCYECDCTNGPNDTHCASCYTQRP
jgi:hypothetical protein